MTQVLRTTRLLAKETVQWEVFSGLDGTGSPAYLTATDLSAHVVEYDGSKGHEYLVDGAGTQVRIPVVLFVVGDTASVPAEQDRITIDSTRVFTVFQKTTVHGLMFTRATPDHFKFALRSE